MVTRRAVLGGALAAGVSVATASRATAQSFAGVSGPGVAAAAGAATTAADAVPFYGARQAGIATPPPAQLAFAAFDVTAVSAAELRALLQAWTAAAARMTRGLVPEPGGAMPPDQPPADSGEAVGLGPSSLTLTFGFGPSLFDRRFGLAERRPRCLADLPALSIDQLDPRRSGGDLMVQACAADDRVALHAVRALRRLAGAAVRLRWLQRGFGSAPASRQRTGTPRNLFGMKDGTLNPVVGTPEFEATVTVPAGAAPAWLRGGSFLAVRRVRQRLDHWDASSLEDQQRTIGRYRVSGAPLSGGSEYTPPDFAARGGGGRRLIPVDAHIRVVHPDFNSGARLYRRGYNFDDGADRSGQLDAGLFFLAYVADLDRQLVPVLRHLAAADAMNEYTLHTASAVFAVPPGTHPGGYVGETLLG